MPINTTDTALVWVITACDVLAFCLIAYIIINLLSRKVSKEKFNKDPLIVLFFVNITISLFFRALLPISYYKGKIEDNNACITFISDFLPQSFLTLAMVSLIFKMTSVMVLL